MMYQLKRMETKIIQEKVIEKHKRGKYGHIENSTLESLIKGKHKDISRLVKRTVNWVLRGLKSQGRLSQTS